jgi:hypothetical protein
LDSEERAGVAAPLAPAGGQTGARSGWLGVVVRVMVMTMMVSASGERGACNNQQEESGKKELLHAMQISTVLIWKCGRYVTRIKSGTVQNGTEKKRTTQS